MSVFFEEQATAAAEGGGMSEETRRKKKTMMVFAVGGLSFLEIAALRFLSNDPLFPFTIIMGTTALVNGNSLLESLAHEF
jgi:hypothetical protein